jgi:peptidoglycan/xylan/chitin deacetylase (PgdA/CDA1 family)
MTWTQARELESSGIEFGIHTSTHRIVSRLDELSLQQELQTSWQRVQSELASPLPVVSWPTGLPGDYTPRDESIAVRLGIEAGVSSAGDYALVGGHDGPPAFTLARFGLPSSISRVLQQGSWIERGKQIVRRH